MKVSQSTIFDFEVIDFNTYLVGSAEYVLPYDKTPKAPKKDGNCLTALSRQYLLQASLYVCVSYHLVCTPQQTHILLRHWQTNEIKPCECSVDILPEQQARYVRTWDRLQRPSDNQKENHCSLLPSCGPNWAWWHSSMAFTHKVNTWMLLCSKMRANAKFGKNRRRNGGPYKANDGLFKCSDAFYCMTKFLLLIKVCVTVDKHLLLSFTNSCSNLLFPKNLNILFTLYIDEPIQLYIYNKYIYTANVSMIIDGWWSNVNISCADVFQ